MYVILGDSILCEYIYVYSQIHNTYVYIIFTDMYHVCRCICILCDSILSEYIYVYSQIHHIYMYINSYIINICT